MTETSMGEPERYDAGYKGLLGPTQTDWKNSSYSVP